MSGRKTRRVLAVASGGGHWVQLMRLRPAFAGCSVAFMTTEPGYRGAIERESGDGRVRFYAVRDANRWNKLALAQMALQVAWVVLRERPDVVVTTGAAPGYFAMRIGRLLGARAVWIDSIANAEEMSMSGRMACRHADLCLTQWPHLAKPQGPRYEGAVL